MKTQPDTTDWEVPAYETKELAPPRHSYCLVIPVLNEGKRFLRQLEILQPYVHEADLIIADGGSTDGSTDPSQLKKFGVRTLLTKTGPGKLSAQLRMAYSYALIQGYVGIITMDGNGKDGPEGIPIIKKALSEGWDYVQGSRFRPGGKASNTPLMRHFANRYLHAPLLSIAAGYFWFTDTTNGFRGYSRRYLLDPRVKPFREVFSRYELLAYLTVRASQIGLAVTEVPVSRSYPEGKVPTKISAFWGNLDLLRTLFITITGGFTPKVSNA
ncbi:MAG: glycosyltransferase family 2 protein [Patescibacteria group bacterium]|nr:glycosyltransferase family 2 protein [Patescibacteria group bacterium]